MLVELTVRNLGVIDDLTLLFGPGMTALTGETGAGKTLVIEAIELLVGGRTDATLVRPGEPEAWAEGRFVDADGNEIVLARAVPAEGRSRGYLDGRMVSAAALAEVGAGLVDLHGQHAHQSLLSAAVQRRALDLYGRVDRSALDAARARVKEIDAALTSLGGDARSRAREIDLLRFQVDELVAARLEDPDEESALEKEESVLAAASSWRDLASAAYDALQGEASAVDAVGGALAGLRSQGGESPFESITIRLTALLAELSDVAHDLRVAGETVTDDPQRLAAVQERRRSLRELRRKYGETLADVIAFGATASARLEELASHDERVAALEQERADAVADVGKAAAQIAKGRRTAAPALAREVERHLRELALPHARFSVDVEGDPPADDVVFGLGANPGEPVLPLAKVASGGELARTMLAARLVLTTGPSTLVFDEVDAGIGGEAALAVGRALAALGEGTTDRQVFVVTHLAQVAAFADAQIAVTKDAVRGRTLASAAAVDGDDRVRELSRMLSGQPDSAAARRHAAELLSGARVRAPARPGRG